MKLTAKVALILTLCSPPTLASSQTYFSSLGSYLNSTTRNLYNQASTDLTFVKSNLENEMNLVSESITNTGVLSCTACKNLLPTLKSSSSSKLLKPIMFNLMLKICKMKGQSKQVCLGSINTYAPFLFKVLDNLDLNNDKVPIRQLICYALDNTCSYPTQFLPTKLQLPSPELKIPNIPKIPKMLNTSRKLKILQLSDIHLDLNYKVGAEANCDKPICCQSDSSITSNSKVKRAANFIGDYGCDTSLQLLDSLLNEVEAKKPFDLILFTGDVPAHDVWNQTVENIRHTENLVYQRLQKRFGKEKVVLAIGNHEPLPANSFKPNSVDGGSGQFYSKLGEQWAPWLTTQNLKDLHRFGAYVSSPLPNLDVVVINTNLCYVLNFWVLDSLDKNEKDPDSLLHWLISKLHSAETAGRSVYLVSHIPPSHPDCFNYWSDAFHQIVKRYKNTIKLQFYGHTHKDEFQVTYQNPTKREIDAIGVSFLAPSVTTFHHLNPGFRVYEVDPIDYQLWDSLTYIGDLQNTIQNNLNAINWKLSYSARNLLVNNWPTNLPLTPQFWHQAIDLMRVDNNAFKNYMLTRDKLFNSTLPHFQPEGEAFKCTAQCKQVILCNLQASNSTQACHRTSPISRH